MRLKLVAMLVVATGVYLVMVLGHAFVFWRAPVWSFEAWPEFSRLVFFLCAGWYCWKIAWVDPDKPKKAGG